MIKCSICSYQCDNWYFPNREIACHINFSWGGGFVSLLASPSRVALAWHFVRRGAPFGVNCVPWCFQRAQRFWSRLGWRRPIPTCVEKTNGTTSNSIPRNNGLRGGGIASPRRDLASRHPSVANGSTFTKSAGTRKMSQKFLYKAPCLPG